MYDNFYYQLCHVGLTTTAYYTGYKQLFRGLCDDMIIMYWSDANINNQIDIDEPAARADGRIPLDFQFDYR